MTQSNFSSPLEEEILDLADEISFADLLELPEVSHFTVRMVAGLRKRLLEEDSQDEESRRVEQLVSKLYYKIGYERRKEAFDSAHFTKSSQSQSTPTTERSLPQKIEPVVLEADRLDPNKAFDLCTSVITALKEKGEDTFTFKTICDNVMNVHTDKGRLQLSSDDLEVTSSNQLRFQQTIAGAVLKLRQKDLVHYRSSKKHYVIF